MVEHLTKEQIGEFKKLFDEMDCNKDGKITLDEIKKGCKSLNIDISEEQLVQIVMASGGKDSFEEGITFTDFLISLSKDNPDVEKIQEEVVKAFKVFDHDGKGEISLTELKHILTTMGQKYTEEEVDEMFSAAGISEDISIDYTKFVHSAFSK